jgi:hypothetical protein
MKPMVRLMVVAVCLVSAVVSAQVPSPEQSAARVAAIKQWIVKSKADLKNYQWMETTVVSYKGEVKSTKINNCYYDVNGTLVKMPVSETAASAPTFGIRGAIARDKKKELTGDMQKAVALVKSYMPPDQAKIEASKAAGKMSMDFLPGGQNIRLNFHDYDKPGDNFSFSMDPNTNRLLGLGVATYVDDPKNAVALAVTLGVLPDGTGYAEKITLDEKSKELQVVVTNSGYRKAN